MPDRNVKLFVMMTGLYFVSRDITTLILYTRKPNKNLAKRPQ